MTTITFDEDVKTSSTNFKNFTSFIEDFVKQNYPDSNIKNEYETAGNMKDAKLPDSFIKNFIKSHE